MEKENKKSFVQGAMILGLAGVAIKILGAAFRIPLANLIGEEGMGYYQSAYPIYVLFLTLATAGIPIAISRMVSERRAMEDYHKAHQVFKVSFFLLFGIGFLSFAICFFGAEFLANEVIENPYAKLPIMAISPALILVPIQAAYRGYFQGMQEMGPTALSQGIEQLFRVVTGLFLAYYLIRYGTEFAASGAAFGATAGSVGGLLAVVIVYFYTRRRIKDRIAKQKKEEDILEEKKSEVLSKILIIAIPITIGAAVMPLMNTIDLVIIIRRLTETGWSATEANMLYGQLTGFVAPLINLPQVLTQAVAISLVPAVAMFFKKGDMDSLRDNVKMGIRLALIIGMPCAIGFIALARPIMTLLYPMQQDSVDGAVPCLIILSIGVIFLSMAQTLTGVLQGIGKQMIPVRNILIGGIVKIFITYILTGVTVINVKGGAIGTIVAYFIAAMLNLYAVRKYTGVNFDVKLTFIKPFVAALTMGFLGFLSYNISTYFIYRNMEYSSSYLVNAWGTLIACITCGITYIFMIMVTGTVTLEEVRKMPKGDKMIDFILKIKRK